MSEHIDRLVLEAYVENVLSAVQRRVVEAHVTVCPECQARLAAAKQIPALLYQLPRERPAPDLAARINAAIAAQRAPVSAEWMHWMVPALFAAGLVLLALAAPQWSRWAGAVATAQLPTAQVILTWLDTFIANPATALEAVMTLAEQTLTGAAEDMDMLTTLATVLLAAASITGLAQLLGSERPLVTATEVQA